MTHSYQPRRTAFEARALAGLAVAIGIVASGVTVAAQDGPVSATDGSEIGAASVLSGANGVYVGPNGNVYTASVAGSEIIVQDPDSGEIVDRIGAERGVAGPDDVFVTDDGTVYWTDLLGGNVGMLRPDGTFTTQQVAPGVNPITMSDDGRLFVARVFLGDGLYELDPELVEEPEVLIEDIVSLNGFDFGPDGMLYGPLQFGGGVVRIDVDAETPEATMVVEGLRTPTAVKFDSQGRLHAVDLAEGQIIRVDLDSGEREVVLDIEGTLDNMAFDSEDRIFTAASSEGQILRVDPDGSVQPLNDAGFTSPAGVAITDDGNTWVVADAFSVWGFGPDGERVTTFYDRFSPPGTDFTGAFSLSADGDRLISSSWFGNVVQVFDPATGEVVQDVRTLAAPLNAIRHGAALVASQGGLPEGNNVVDVDTGEELIGGLVLPVGLASDGDTLYVSDWALGTISTVSADGEVGVLAEGLAMPEGLAVDGDRLLVVEEGLGRVSAVDRSSGTVTPVIEGLAIPGPVVPGTFPQGAISSVAVAADGSIVVTSNGDKTVRVFAPAGG
jgi:sugar lactone lactonase YvrE